MCPKVPESRRATSRRSRGRVMRHRGHKKAVVAVAHAILVTAYHLLLRHTTYQDPGTDYSDRRRAERVRRCAIQALERRGDRGWSQKKGRNRRVAASCRGAIGAA